LAKDSREQGQPIYALAHVDAMIYQLTMCVHQTCEAWLANYGVVSRAEILIETEHRATSNR